MSDSLALWRYFTEIAQLQHLGIAAFLTTERQMTGTLSASTGRLSEAESLFVAMTAMLPEPFLILIQESWRVAAGADTELKKLSWRLN